jgi:iron-sulfur cluster repair protein YtfE (RIC family)
MTNHSVSGHHAGSPPVLHSVRPDHLTVFAARQAEAQRTGFAFSARDRRADFVAHYPELDALCERLGFGWDHALAEFNHEPARMMLELARAANPPIAPTQQDLSSASLDELVEHLLRHHHLPLRGELNRLSLLIQHLAGGHPHQRDVQDLAGGFSLLRDSLLVHMLQEEAEAFPLCRDLETRQRSAGAVAAEPLHRMAAGHLEMGDDLDFLARLVQRAGLSNDPDAALVLRGLRAMENNLRIHTAIENEILLPAALFIWELMSRPNPQHTVLNQDPAAG